MGDCRRPLDRRLFLNAALGAGVASGAAVFGSPVSAQKVGKTAAGYQDMPFNEFSCAACQNYNGDGTCIAVEGEISPDGWCRLFRAKA